MSSNLVMQSRMNDLNNVLFEALVEYVPGLSAMLDGYRDIEVVNVLRPVGVAMAPNGVPADD